MPLMTTTKLTTWDLIAIEKGLEMLAQTKTVDADSLARLLATIYKADGVTVTSKDQIS